jgi:hypothetical protein
MLCGHSGLLRFIDCPSHLVHIVIILLSKVNNSGQGQSHSCFRNLSSMNFHLNNHKEGFSSTPKSHTSVRNTEHQSDAPALGQEGWRSEIGSSFCSKPNGWPRSSAKDLVKIDRWEITPNRVTSAITASRSAQYAELCLRRLRERGKSRGQRSIQCFGGWAQSRVRSHTHKTSQEPSGAITAESHRL